MVDTCADEESSYVCEESLGLGDCNRGANQHGATADMVPQLGRDPTRWPCAHQAPVHLLLEKGS